MTTLLPALAGANTIYGAGMLELGMTFSGAQLLIDNDIISMVRKAVGGIEVNQETLALEAIQKVGIGKDFLALKQTRDLIDLPSSPILINREMRGDWQRAGKKDLATVAQEKADEIVKTHNIVQIDRDIRKDMEDIVRKADKAMTVHA
jgi:trimethylamine--corrinoid protein Co-methyltransferase